MEAGACGEQILIFVFLFNMSVLETAPTILGPLFCPHCLSGPVSFSFFCYVSPWMSGPYGFCVSVWLSLVMVSSSFSPSLMVFLFLLTGTELAALNSVAAPQPIVPQGPQTNNQVGRSFLVQSSGQGLCHLPLFTSPLSIGAEGSL